MGLVLLWESKEEVFGLLRSFLPHSSVVLLITHVFYTKAAAGGDDESYRDASTVPASSVVILDTALTQSLSSPREFLTFSGSFGKGVGQHRTQKDISCHHRRAMLLHYKLKNVVQKSTTENLVHSLYLLVRGGKTDNKTFPPHFFPISRSARVIHPFHLFGFSLYIFPSPQKYIESDGREGRKRKTGNKKVIAASIFAFSTGGKCSAATPHFFLPRAAQSPTQGFPILEKSIPHFSRIRAKLNRKASRSMLCCVYR